MRESCRITFGEGIEGERKQDYRPTLSRGPRSSRGYLVAKCHEDIDIAPCQLAKGSVITLDARNRHMLQREIVALVKAERRHSIDKGDYVRRVPRRNRRNADTQNRQSRLRRTPPGPQHREKRAVEQSKKFPPLHSVHIIEAEVSDKISGFNPRRIGMLHSKLSRC